MATGQIRGRVDHAADLDGVQEARLVRLEGLDFMSPRCDAQHTAADEAALDSIGLNGRLDLAQSSPQTCEATTHDQ